MQLLPTRPTHIIAQRIHWLPNLTVPGHVQLDEVLKVVNFRRQILDLVVAEAEFPQPGQPEEVLGQVSEVVGVQEELLEGSGVPEEVVGHGGQGAVPLVDVLDLAVTPFEDGDALKHFLSLPSGQKITLT